MEGQVVCGEDGFPAPLAEYIVYFDAFHKHKVPVISMMSKKPMGTKLTKARPGDPDFEQWTPQAADARRALAEQPAWQLAVPADRQIAVQPAQQPVLDIVLYEKPKRVETFLGPDGGITFMVNPGGLGALPATIIILIDCSTSMDESMDAELGLTRLDMAKYAAISAIKALPPGTRVQVIKFDTYAKKVGGLMRAGEPGISTILSKIDALGVNGSTNYAAALDLAREVASDISDLCSVLLLTDGKPMAFSTIGCDAINDRDGGLTLDYVNTVYKNLGIKICPILLGCDASPQTCLEIAQMTNGILRYVNDTTRMCEAFARFLAAAITTEIAEVCVAAGNIHTYKKRRHDNLFYVGSVRIDFPAYFCASFARDGSYPFEFTGRGLKETIVVDVVRGQISVDGQKPPPDPMGQCSALRLAFNWAKIVKCNAFPEDATNFLLGKICRDVLDPALADALEAFIVREMPKAVCKDWGIPYVAMLASTLGNGLPSTKFEETSCLYESPSWKNAIAAVENAWGAGKPKNSLRGTKAITEHTAQNIAQGGCWSGGTTVLKRTPEGDVWTKTSNILPGDKVRVAFSDGACSWDVVKYIVRTKQFVGCMMQITPTVLITPYHPIRFYEKWVHPKSLMPTVQGLCDMYTFVMMTPGASISLGGEDPVHSIWAATLGHKLRGEVIGHPFYGDSAVNGISARPNASTQPVDVVGVMLSGLGLPIRWAFPHH